MKRAFLLLIFIFQISLLFGQNSFSFVFLPDIHLEPDSAVEVNLDRVIKKINKLKPDFLITGGDMIYTAKNGDDKKAKKLFDLMDEKFTKFKMPIYYTMGNHEVVGILPNCGIDSSHPQWGKRMYEERYGKRYKSFVNSGWKFFLLDGIKIREKEMDYTTGVDSMQIEWLKYELLQTDSNMPIVIVIHTPLINPYAIINTQYQILSKNAETVLNLFDDYNLKMVLQGHNHKYMNLFFGGIYYLSGGSTLLRTEPVNEGFLFVKIKNNVEKIKFIQTGGNPH